MRIPKSIAPIESRFAAIPCACRKMNEKSRALDGYGRHGRLLVPTANESRGFSIPCFIKKIALHPFISDKSC
jgi:hypothetical protein